MSDFLQQMAKSSAARAAAITTKFNAEILERPSFPLVLQNFDLIAELKDRSPAEGALANADLSRVARAQSYADGGAAAISVLTEPDRFDGSLDHLAEVADAMITRKVPVMRKDFLVAPTQILEAKAAGASGVLLITAMLSESELASMLDCAFDHDLFVLLESFDANDLQRTANLLGDAKVREQAGRNKLLVGVNTRDLRTLAVDPRRLGEFAARLPGATVAVAESGQRSAADAVQVAGLGYRMALVGTALMKADAPAKLIRDMLAAGRGRMATQ